MREVPKVTDPAKIVTDPVLLNVLAKRSIDKDYVEFCQDYAPGSPGKEHSPYAKFYRDLKSNKRFMVVSGLPMVKVEGHPIEPAWFYSENQGTWYSRANLFSAIVNGLDVQITCLSDQPYGAKAGDKVSYRTQLFLDGKEVLPKSKQPDWLEIDPQNENYHQNVLEWDYGICKRRLRIIEGSILGSWVFPAKPEGEIRIRYNQSGSFRLRLGEYRLNDDEELITKSAFAQAEYPLIINDSATFYPDPSTSVDGFVRWEGTPTTDWASIVAAADGHVVGYTATMCVSTQITAENVVGSSKWIRLYRGFWLFPIDLPEGAQKSAATLSLYGQAKADGLSIAANFKTQIYSSTPASNTVLANADFDQVGSTPYCDTPLAYGDMGTVGYNDFAFNATGIAAIPLTGIFKTSTRCPYYDVAGNTPNWVQGASSYMQFYTAEQGSGYKPKLVVEYSLPPGISPGIFIWDGADWVDQKSGDFSGQEIRIETRTSDPASSADGRIWLRTDL